MKKARKKVDDENLNEIAIKIIDLLKTGILQDEMDKMFTASKDNSSELKQEEVKTNNIHVGSMISKMSHKENNEKKETKGSEESFDVTYEENNNNTL